MNPNCPSKKMSGEEPARKKFKYSTISEHINGQEFQRLFSEHWQNYEPLDSGDLCVVTKPFRLCKISNFIRCETFMEDLKAELAEVKSRRQSIDLYQFEQTSDLADVDSTNLRRLWETFRSDFADWTKRNTSVELNKKISMSSSVYYDTDYLLCHDDDMGDRRIAFVLYLSKDWSVEDGGTLDLFDTDENGAPGKVVRSLVPEYNSLIFFEVHERSYHQVGEVKSSEKSRWTINGWLHGPVSRERRPPRVDPQYPLVSPDASRDAQLRSWIRNCYLDDGIAKTVQKSVEADSYTFLSNFFIKDAYETLTRDITSNEIIWTRVGPPDVRNYETAEVESLPNKLREFYTLFGNIEIFRLLKKYTELDLVPDENAKEDGNPRMRIELQRWSSGCYTLIRDKSSSLDDDDTTKIASSMSEDDEDVSAMDRVMRIAFKSEQERIASLRDEKSDEKIIADPSKKKKSCASLDKSSRGCAPMADRTKLTDARDNLEDGKDSRSEKNIDSPRASGTDESGDSVIPKRLLRGQSRDEKRTLALSHQPSCSSVDEKSAPRFNRESEDSDVSDIGDYLSDRFERSIENSDEDDQEDQDYQDYQDYEEDECEEEDGAISPSVCEPGSLDVIIQFNTGEAPSDETIDYIDPNQQEGALIHVPFKDNHLCLVYKTLRTTRLHKYVNHYCKGYFYNLICTYYE